MLAGVIVVRRSRRSFELRMRSKSRSTCILDGACTHDIDIEIGAPDRRVRPSPNSTTFIWILFVLLLCLNSATRVEGATLTKALNCGGTSQANASESFENDEAFFASPRAGLAPKGYKLYDHLVDVGGAGVEGSARLGGSPQLLDTALPLYRIPISQPGLHLLVIGMLTSSTASQGSIELIPPDAVVSTSAHGIIINQFVNITADAMYIALNVTGTALEIGFHSLFGIRWLKLYHDVNALSGSCTGGAVDVGGQCLCPPGQELMTTCQPCQPGYTKHVYGNTNCVLAFEATSISPPPGTLALETGKPELSISVVFSTTVLWASVVAERVVEVSAAGRSLLPGYEYSVRISPTSTNTVIIDIYTVAEATEYVITIPASPRSVRSASLGRPLDHDLMLSYTTTTTTRQETSILRVQTSELDTYSLAYATSPVECLSAQPLHFLESKGLPGFSEAIIPLTVFALSVNGVCSVNITHGGAYSFLAGAVTELTQPIFSRASPYRPKVSVGEKGSCYVTRQGTATCWGNTDSVFGATVNPGVPLMSVSVSRVDGSADQPQACGITTDGGAVCWGYRDGVSASSFLDQMYSQIILGTEDRSQALITGAGYLFAYRVNKLFVGLPTTTKALQACTGKFYVCWIEEDMSPKCFGSNGFDDDIQPPPGIQVAQISCGTLMVCGVALNGTLLCWGEATLVPPTGTDFVQVSVGKDSSCAVRRNNSLECWGDADHTANIPTTSHEFIEVSQAGRLGCGLTTSYSLVCWTAIGYSPEGQPAPLPKPNLIRLHTTNSYSWALLSNGTVVVAGLNSVPPPDGGEQLTRIDTASSSSGCGVTTSHEAYCWGSGSIVTDVPTNLQFLQISASSTLACGVQTNHTLFCWGNNADSATSTAHQYVSPGTVVKVLILGSDSMCSLNTTGHMLCWKGGSVTSFGSTIDALQFIDMEAASSSTIALGCGLTAGGDMHCRLSTSIIRLERQGVVALGKNGARVQNPCSINRDGFPACTDSATKLLPSTQRYLSVAFASNHRFCGTTPLEITQCVGNNADSAISFSATVEIAADTCPFFFSPNSFYSAVYSADASVISGCTRCSLDISGLLDCFNEHGPWRLANIGSNTLSITSQPKFFSNTVTTITSGTISCDADPCFRIVSSQVAFIGVTFEIESTRALVEASDSSVVFLQCTFKQGSGSVVGLPIKATRTSLYIVQTQFQSLTQEVVVRCERSSFCVFVDTTLQASTSEVAMISAASSGVVLLSSFTTSSPTAILHADTAVAAISGISIQASTLPASFALLHLLDSSLFLSNSTFSGVAGKTLGVVFAQSSNLAVADCSFTTSSLTDLARATPASEVCNAPSTTGGASLSLLSSTASIIRSNITQSSVKASSSGGCGGGVYAGPSTNLIIDACRFEGNEAGQGGSLCIDTAAVRIGASTFMSGDAWYGGAIFSQNGMVNLTDTSFTSNTADLDGGALFLDRTTTVESNGLVSLTNNQAKGGGGGGLYSANLSFVHNWLFTDNQAVYGHNMTDGVQALLTSFPTNRSTAPREVVSIPLQLSDGLNQVVRPYSGVTLGGYRNLQQVMFALTQQQSTFVFGRTQQTPDAQGSTTFGLSFAEQSGVFSVDFQYNVLSCPVLGPSDSLLLTLGINMTSCPLGSVYDSTNGVCQACAAGYFSNDTSLTSCLPCAAGSYTNSTGRSSCDNCGEGVDLNAQGFDAAVRCVLCPAGRKSVSGVCKDCDPGSFSNATGFTKCFDCSTGTFTSLSQSVACNPCAAGSFSNTTGLSKCFLCGSGLAANSTGLTTCSDCDPGVDLSQTSQGAVDCIYCPAGRKSTSTGCTDCAPGRFGNSTGLTKCFDCGLGYFSSLAQSVGCNPCAAGSFSNDTGLSECFTCAAGSVSNTSGLSTCFDCGPGADTTAQQVGGVRCIYCPAGRKSTSTGCADCAPGSFTNSSGLTKCFECGLGQFSTFVASVGCNPCAAGSFSNITGGSQCSPCAAGTFSNTTNAVQCLPCPAGTFSIQDLGAVECLFCEPGRYSSDLSASTCKPCAAGRYSDLRRATTCLNCTLGEYSSASATRCIICNIGQHSPSPNIQCVECLPGRYANSSRSTQCTACQPGKYTSVIGSGDCTQCEPGRYSNSPNATTCTDCTPGRVAAGLGSRTCDECSRPAYSQNTGGRFCDYCPTGFTVTYNEDGSFDTCVECDISLDCLQGQPVVVRQGFYSVIDNATNRIDTFQCSESRCSSNGQCTTGRVTPASSNPLCGQCLPGYSEWGETCVACDAVDYGAWFGLILLMWVIVLLVHATAQISRGTTKITVYFIQMTLLLLAEQSWTDSLAFLSFDVLSVSGTSCLMPIDPANRHILAMLLPLASFGLLFLTALLHLTVGNALCRVLGRTAYPLEDVKDLPMPWQASTAGRNLSPSITGPFLLSPYIRTMIALVLFTFNTIVTNALNTFNCIEVEGTKYMVSSPAIKCTTDGPYQGLVSVAILTLLAYAVVMPMLFAAGLIRHARQDNMLASRVRRFWGVLYEPYKLKNYLFFAYTLLRRTVGIIIVVFVYEFDQRHIRNGLLAIFNTTFLAVHLLRLPFGSQADNMWESGSLLLLAFIPVLLEMGLEDIGLLLITAGFSIPLVLWVGVLKVRKLAQRGKQGQRGTKEHPLELEPFENNDLHGHEAVINTNIWPSSSVPLNTGDSRSSKSVT